MKMMRWVWEFLIDFNECSFAGFCLIVFCNSSVADDWKCPSHEEKRSNYLCDSSSNDNFQRRVNITSSVIIRAYCLYILGMYRLGSSAHTQIKKESRSLSKGGMEGAFQSLDHHCCIRDRGTR